MKTKLIFGAVYALALGFLVFQTSTRTPFRAGLSTDTLESYTQSLYPIVNDSLGLVGRVMKYNDVATEGYGLPAIIDRYGTSTQIDSSGLVDISGSTASGLYRVNAWIACTGIDGGNSTLKVKVFWRAANATTVLEDSTSVVTMSAAGQHTYKQFFVSHTGGDSVYVQFNVIHDNVSQDQFHSWIVTERLN